MAPHDAGLDKAAIRQQLELLLASPHFRNSKRSQALLKHVVEAYLEGALDRVKERVIGFEVFRREADYDTNQDSVVRTTAAEVRKRLAQYYLEPGHGGEIRVGLPQGSYVPEFRLPEPAPEVERARRNGRKLARRAAIAAAVVLAAGGGAWMALGHRRSDLDRFWMPLVEDRAEVVVCIEQPLRIFRFTGPRTNELNQKMVGAPPLPAAADKEREAASVRLSELIPTGERYFSYGDLMTASRLAELLARKGKSFQVLGDRVTNYDDLRGHPAVLLGQFNNKWTVGLTGGLRYYLGKNLTTERYEVLDRQNPGKVLASAPKESNRPEEYCIVSRVFDVSTEKTIVAVTATTLYGTLAAGDFLTREAYPEEAFRNAPAGWWKKNIQVVLRSTMVAGSPGPPKPIVVYFW